MSAGSTGSGGTVPARVARALVDARAFGRRRTVRRRGWGRGQAATLGGERGEAHAEALQRLVGDRAEVAAERAQVVPVAVRGGARVADAARGARQEAQHHA